MQMYLVQAISLPWYEQRLHQPTKRIPFRLGVIPIKREKPPMPTILTGDWTAVESHHGADLLLCGGDMKKSLPAIAIYGRNTRITISLADQASPTLEAAVHRAATPSTL